MANIENELTTIRGNRYGENVRTAVHDSIEAINNESTHALEVAETSDESTTKLVELADNKVSEIASNVDQTKEKMSEVVDIYDKIGLWPAEFSVEDSDGDQILDSDGNPIFGEIIFLISK